jgi:glycosyltransferase involved in cell wall biosynthesis
MSLKKRIADLLASEFLRPYSTRWLYFGLLGRPRPAYLTDCWRYPWSPFPSAAARSLFARPPRGPDLLFLPMTDWHARTQRTQHLALALAAAGHRCFYLNPHLGFEFPGVCGLHRGHRISVLAPQLFELHLRLPREPVIHHRLPTLRENKILADGLRHVAQVSKDVGLVQVVSLPFWLDVSLALREAFGCPIVYDCHDFLGGFSRVARQVVERELELFRHCNLALFSSQPLMDAKLEQLPWLRGKSLLIRNAAGAGDCASAEERPQAATGPHPSKRIGYAGALDHWFDVAAVSEAARRRPEWEFVLIGRVEDPAVLQLGELPNVKLLGEVPYSELRVHLAGFDVALIPFVRNELTVAANPIKLYEYFGYGLPVVSSNLPEVRMFGDLVYISRDARDFAEKVEAAAAERDPSARRRRIAVASHETWTARALALQAAFARLMA